MGPGAIQIASLYLLRAFDGLAGAKFKQEAVILALIRVAFPISFRNSRRANAVALCMLTVRSVMGLSICPSCFDAPLLPRPSES